MGRTVFLQLAEEWLKGHETIPCGGWTGTITQEESINLITTYNTGAARGVSASGDTNESIVATASHSKERPAQWRPACATLTGWRTTKAAAGQ